MWVLTREREHFSRNVMVSVGVSRIGKTRLVFIDSGAKVNSSYYCNIVLKKGLLPHIRAICRHYRWTLQQDGAPAHTAGQRWTIRKKSTSTSLNLTWPWTPNSPDINPVDYPISGALQQRVYHQRHFKMAEELKRAIVTEWQKLSQRFIDNSINEWRRRLETFIKNGGGNTEHCKLDWAAAHHFNTIERKVNFVNKTKHLTPIKVT